MVEKEPIQEYVKKTMETEITLKGRKFTIKKLGYMKVIKLGIYIRKYVKEGSEQAKLLTKDGTNIVEDVMNIFAALGEEKAPGFIAIILGTEDVEFCKDIPFEDITELTAVLAECNDWEKITKNLMRVINSVTGK